MVCSPRFLRPFDVVVKNNIGEVDFQLTYQETALHYVNVRYLTKARTQLNDTSIDDSIMVVIDIMDCGANYVREVNYKGVGFTIKKGDRMIFQDEELTIVSYGEKVNLNGKIQFVEVICQRSNSST